MKNNDVFSVIALQAKPYELRPPRCYEDKALQILKPYLQRQLIDIKEWCNHGTDSSIEHYVMNVYNCCQEAAHAMIRIGSQILTSENPDLPEDLCFYRQDVVWFSAVTHECIGDFYAISEEDLLFLKTVGIRFCNGWSLKGFCIPEESLYQ